MSGGEKRENRQVWRETERGLKSGRGEWRVEGLCLMEMEQEKKRGGSFSESDCTLRRGGVYPASRADQSNANYSAVKTAKIISSSHSSVFCNCWEPV